MANVRKCRETFFGYNFVAKFFKIFLRPEMDSAHARVPYRIFFGSKFENFVPAPFKMARCKIGKDGSNSQNLSFQVFLISYVIERPLAVPKRYNMSGSG
uniref:Uncharacterized protein n=1 Tax=Meloidogyne enterolobii TaxID=390850 RepID=A0A6V7X1P3_MELEN|nr:unnamed protein product [Meloidogyne enterolobii]